MVKITVTSFTQKQTLQSFIPPGLLFVSVDMRIKGNMGQIEDYIGKIICGDTEKLIKEIPDNSIDLIVTDPPYLINYTTCHRKDTEHDFCVPIQNDDNEDLIVLYIKECYRILKPDTAIYMFCSSQKVDIFKREIEKYFHLKNIIIWVKNNWSAGDLYGAYGRQYEMLIFAHKALTLLQGDKRLTDVWKFNRVVGNMQKH